MMSPEEIMNHSSSPRSSGMSRKTKRIIAGAVIVALLIIIIPVSITVSNNAKESAAIAELRGMVASALEKEGVDASGLSDSSTAQGKAFNWLYFDNPNLGSMDRSSVLQRYALAAFYYASYQVETLYTTDPPIWVSSDQWLSELSECDWHGIVCNSRFRVTEISLESNALTGKIAPDLVLLREHLVTLDLTTNLIYMEPADLEFFGSMTKLETLLLDDNYILTEEGLPAGLSECTDLLKLRLSYNLMGGELSDDLFGKLTKLTHLEVESNFFSGSMPASVGKMDKLVYLYMRRNSMEFNLNFLKGGQMTDLFSLWLDANFLTGTIPTEIGLLTELASLSLTNGTLSQKIPTEIGKLTGLRRLWLYNNQLTGTIPAAMSSLTKLEVFEVQYNKVTGHMPLGVCKAIGESTYKNKAIMADCVGFNCTCCEKCTPPLR